MSSHRRKIIGSLLFAGLWAVVAAFQPTSTFHLAPLIVAAWPAIGERRLEGAVLLALAGSVIAGIATGLLFVAGLLQGPSLLPWGGAGLESLFAAAVGMFIGVVPAVLGRLG